MTHRRNPRGFTLIELMLVVAIIGILASVAIPSFQKVRVRSKTAERALLVKSIRSAAEDLYLRDGKFPSNWGGGFSGLSCVPNPAGVPGPQKKPFSTVAAGWNSLSLLIQGNVYYQYNLSAWLGAGTGNLWVWVDGDLDGDSIFSSKQVGYQLTNTGWSAMSVWPPDGLEDDKNPVVALRTF